MKARIDSEALVYFPIDLPGIFSYDSPMTTSPLRFAIIAGIAIVLFILGAMAAKNSAVNPLSGIDSASSTEEAGAADGENGKDAPSSPTAVVPTGSGIPGTGAVPPPPAPPGTPGGTSGPYTKSADDALSSIEKFTLPVNQAGEVPITPEPGAELILTSISTLGEEAVANIEIRRTSGTERFTLKSGATVALQSQGAKQVVLEIVGINIKDKNATIRVVSFPKTVLAPRVPATVWLLPRQVLSYASAGDTSIRIMLLDTLPEKAQVSVTEYKGNTVSRAQTQWIPSGGRYAGNFFTITLDTIRPSNDPVYTNALATWAPDVVSVSVRTK